MFCSCSFSFTVILSRKHPDACYISQLTFLSSRMEKTITHNEAIKFCWDTIFVYLFSLKPSVNHYLWFSKRESGQGSPSSIAGLMISWRKLIPGTVFYSFHFVTGLSFLARKFILLIGDVDGKSEIQQKRLLKRQKKSFLKKFQNWKVSVDVIICKDHRNINLYLQIFCWCCSQMAQGGIYAFSFFSSLDSSIDSITWSDNDRKCSETFL